MFEIVQVALQESQEPEYLGTKSKFWYRDDNGRRVLFKADDRNCGEDWSEKVACHLCKLLGLPHVHYEMAQWDDGEGNLLSGVVCQSFTQGSWAERVLRLDLGNSLLFKLDPAYPQNKVKYNVRQHTVDAVSKIVSSLQSPSSVAFDLVGIANSALGCFIGYVMLDAWIANQDRHHENWGAVQTLEPLTWPSFIAGPKCTRNRLAPTFDHAAGLARNLSDDERKERLETKDKNRHLEAFTLKARSAFYKSDSDTRAMSTFDAFWAFAEKAKPAARFWLKRLEAIDQAAIQEILDQVPESRMSPITKEFTLELLKINQKRLLEKAI